MHEILEVIGARKRLAITLIAGVSIIGCRVGPRYRPPTVALQPFQRSSGGSAGSFLPSIQIMRHV